MSLTRKVNPMDLTEDETQLLKGSNIPPEVKQFAARQHDNIGTRTSAFRKIAAAARAEADALLAIRDRDLVMGEMANLAEARDRIAQLERRANALEASATEKDRQIRRLMAAPAAVVHSDD